MALSSVIAGLAIAGLTVALSACATGHALPSATVAANPTELTVFAAASLRDAFSDLSATYESSHRDIRLGVTTDASSALRAQVETGAAADVFASADTVNPQRLVDEGLAAGPARVFAGNELAIVTPATDPAGIHDAYDIARPGVRIVAAGPDVPISLYAARLIENLQAYRGAQAGFRDAIERNVVSREDNVRAVLAKIELGEGDAAIVYATDARGDARIRVVPLPPGVNVRADYAAVALTASTHSDEATRFLDWLTGAQARAILVGDGFVAPP